MTRTQLRDHYLHTAQYLRDAGNKRWARHYAKLAIRVMEGR